MTEPASAKTVLDQCDQLADISAIPNGILRAYLTPEHKRGNALVSTWMEAAGMSVWQDAAGNLCGRYAAEDAAAPVLILGSHLDTVPNSGKYDGIVGVLGAIEIIRCFNVDGLKLPFHIDVIGFGDEEGVRFGATLLGSRAVAGDWSEDLWRKTDAHGVSLAQAYCNFGLDDKQIHLASRAGDNILAYWELHIEQGPVLEHEDWPVGIVTAIAGAKRYSIDITGMAGHAGTVPMNLRQDAMVAAAKITLLAEYIANKYALVATVGKVDVRPGGVNIIPGNVNMSLDIRSDDDAKRDRALEELFSSVAKDCSNVQIEWTQTHSANAVGCEPRFQSLFADVIAEHQIKPIYLLSGAGHDAMAMATICPVAMLFMRCKLGISHHPDEKIYPYDTQVALDVLRDAIVRFAASQ